MKHSCTRSVLSCLVAAAGLSAAAQVHGDTVRRISQREAPVVEGNDNSRYAQISANGQYVAFLSSANNLPGSGPAFTVPMIMVKNLTTGAISWQSQRGDFESPPLSNPRAMGGVTSRMCVNNSGTVWWENNSDNSVGFDACPDSNGFSDIYYNSSYSPTFSSLAGGFCGTPGNGNSQAPAMAWDSSKVAFESTATNFGVTDLNGRRDIYMRLVSGGPMSKVSFAPGNAATNNDSYTPSVSNNGTFVAYASLASNIVANDTNAVQDIFVANFTGNAVTERVSVTNAGGQGNGTSSSPAISADGRYVVFVSTATNLVSGDSNGVADIFVRDRQLGTTKRVSVATGGAQANGASSSPAISADGRYIVYASDATNLVAGDTNAVRDVFLFDQQTQETRRVSLTAALGQANGASDSPTISGDGLRIAFDSAATNIVAGDGNGRSDVFLYTVTPPPANDNCGGAVAIGLGLTSGTTLGAAADGSSICGTSSLSPDVYYTFTPSRTAYVKFEIETGTYDSVLSLHSGCPATGANQIACDDDLGAGSLSLIVSQYCAAGVPVTVRVSGFNGASGDFTLRLTEVAPPNDLCATPIVLPVNVTVDATNVAAGNESAATCQSNSAADVYFSFTPVCTGEFTIETLGGLDTVLSVHTGCPATLTNSIDCDDDSGIGFASRLTISLSGGIPYTIRVAGWNNNQGGFGIRVNDANTINDECELATVLAAGQVPFNNCAATPAATFSLCGQPMGRDLWYMYTSTDSAVPVTISTGGSSVDTVMAVYSGCPSGGGVQIACNDDFFLPSRASLVRVDAPAGTTLWIRVGGWAGQGGAGLLAVSQCLADVASSEGPFPDGTIDGNDFIAFINSFGIGDATVDPVADVITDGTIDGNDFIAFINAFAAGC